jgi:hypothetical protein
MIECRGRLRFMHEAFFGLIIAAQFGRQEFERDRAFELGVYGF